jgi:hypothetical protein
MLVFSFFYQILRIGHAIEQGFSLSEKASQKDIKRLFSYDPFKAI